MTKINLEAKQNSVTFCAVFVSK